MKNEKKSREMSIRSLFRSNLSELFEMWEMQASYGIVLCIEDIVLILVLIFKKFNNFFEFLDVFVLL